MRRDNGGGGLGEGVTGEFHPYKDYKNTVLKMIFRSDLFSFIVYDAFEQWKTLFHLMCSCIEAVDKYPDLFEAFIGKFGNIQPEPFHLTNSSPWF